MKRKFFVLTTTSANQLAAKCGIKQLLTIKVKMLISNHGENNAKGMLHSKATDGKLISAGFFVPWCSLFSPIRAKHTLYAPRHISFLCIMNLQFRIIFSNIKDSILYPRTQDCFMFICVNIATVLGNVNFGIQSRN